MIIDMICTPLLLFGIAFIALLPVLEYIPDSIISTLDMIIKAMQFFPLDTWIIVISNIVFWITLHLIWSIVNFILRLIPFLNMG